jgi:hypothetical protein
MPRKNALPYFNTSSDKYRGRTSDPLKYLQIPKAAINHAYKAITSNETTFKYNDCLISTRASNKSSTSAADGGPRVAFAFAGIQYNLLSKIVYMLYHDIKPNNDRQVASHLCGNHYCLNHCVWEMMYENVYREECHIGFLKECPHEPKCLKLPDEKIIKQMILKHQEKQSSQYGPRTKKQKTE